MKPHQEHTPLPPDGARQKSVPVPSRDGVRTAIGMLLNRPGATTETAQESMQNFLQKKTDDVQESIGRILHDRVRFVLMRAFDSYLIVKRPAQPEEARLRMEQVLKKAFQPGEDCSGLLRNAEINDCKIYNVQNDVFAEYHAFNAEASKKDGMTGTRHLPGMAGEEIGGIVASFDSIFDSVIDGDDERQAIGEIRALNAMPPSPELQAFADRPRALYERLLLETGATYMQRRRTTEWRDAVRTGKNNDAVVASIRKDPAVFLRALHERWNTTQGKEDAEIFIPRFLRKGKTLGVAEYDLPVELVLQLKPEERKALEVACHTLASGATGTEKFFYEDLERSFRSLPVQADGGEPVEYRYQPDALEILRRRVQVGERESGTTSSKRRDKWIDFTPSVFAQDHGGARAMLDTFGYIPEALLRSYKDINAINSAFNAQSFEKIESVHSFLVQEIKGYDDNVKITGMGLRKNGRLLNARAQLLESLLLSDHMQSLVGKITVDVNGLYMDLHKRDSKGSKNNLAAHIPFAYVSDAVCGRLQQDGWLNAHQVREVRIQRASGLNDEAQYAALDQEKLREVALVLGDPPDQAYESLSRRITDPSQHQSLVQSLQPNAKNVVNLPLSATVRMLREAQQSGPESVERRVTDLFRLASTMQQRLGPQPDLSDPRHYDVQKAIVEPLAEELSGKYGHPGNLFYDFISRGKGKRDLLRFGIETGGTQVAVLLDLDKLSDNTFTHIRSISSFIGGANAVSPK